MCDNWDNITKEYKPLIGKFFISDKGVKNHFFGLVHADDDYYYGLVTKGGKLNLLSCVGSIENYGYELIK